jgi:predicted nucleic acid-binding protein
VTLVFVDTNLFVYAIDEAEPCKMRRARQVLEYLHGTAQGVISTQVVGEFVRWAGAGRQTRAERARVAARGRELLSVWPIVPTSAATSEDALATWETHDMSYWDAQIHATARAAKCTYIVTEDTRHPVEGVRYVNPFCCDCARWLRE